MNVVEWIPQSFELDCGFDTEMTLIMRFVYQGNISCRYRLVKGSTSTQSIRQQIHDEEMVATKIDAQDVCLCHKHNQSYAVSVIINQVRYQAMIRARLYVFVVSRYVSSLFCFCFCVPTQIWQRRDEELMKHIKILRYATRLKEFPRRTTEWECIVRLYWESQALVKFLMNWLNDWLSECMNERVSAREGEEA